MAGGIDQYTVLCLHGDGTDASTSFPDSSAAAHTMTARGNAQVDTAQSKFGGAAMLFDGSGDWIDTPDSADWDLGSGNFTIDLWVRFNTVPGGAGSPFISQWHIGSSQQAWRLEYNPFTPGFHFEWSTTGSNNPQISETWAPTTGVWYHVAIVRSGNNLLSFVDGTQLGSTDSITDTIFNSSGILQIGGIDGGGGFDGWLDEVRVSKGIARWTSNFTPPTSAYTVPTDSPAGYFDPEIIPRLWFDDLAMPVELGPWVDREFLTYPDSPYPGGLVHARAQGTAAIGATQVKPSGLTHTRAQDSPSAVPSLAAASITRTRALGTIVQVKTTITPASLTHTRAQGSSTVNTTLPVASITHTRALDGPTVSMAFTVSPAGLVHSRSLGSPQVNTTVLTASLEHARALGDPTADWSPPVGNVNPASLTRTPTLGGPQVNTTITPTALSHSRALGSPTIAQGPEPASIVHTRALDSPSIAPSLSVTSLTHTRAISTVTIATAPRPASLVHTRAQGTVTLKVTITPASLVHSRALGAPGADDGIPDPTPSAPQLAYGDFDFGMFTPEKVEP